MANEWNMDYQAGRHGWTHYQPINYADYEAGKAAARGPASQIGGAHVGGGVGIFGFVVLLPILVVAFTVYAALFPLSGAIVLAVGYVVTHVMLAGNTVNPLMKLIVTALPCLIALLLSFRLEQAAARHLLYRRLRHALRIIGFALLANEYLSPFLVAPPMHLGFGIVHGLKVGQIVIMLAAGLVTHLIQAWLDRYDGDWRGAICHAWYIVARGRRRAPSV